MRSLRLAVALGALSSATAFAQATAAPVWPTKGWPVTTPQAVGLNGAVLDSIDVEISSGRKEGLHTLQSVTKTITSVVIATAVARNEFPSLDTPVLSFFDVAKVKTSTNASAA